MQLRLGNIKEYNGFSLQNPVNFDDKIIVLTGKNGSGKTRILEGIQKSHISLHLSDSLLAQQDVKFVEQSNLGKPQPGAMYNDSHEHNRFTETLQFYDIIKKDFDAPFDPQKQANNDVYRPMRDSLALNYSSLYKLSYSIAKRLGKPASQLTHDDFNLFYEEPSVNILGTQNVSKIVNQYIKRLNQNDQNEFFHKEKNREVKFFSEKEFIDQFGDKPWVLINRILADTFDGKFQFSIPDESSHSYSYQAQLLQGNEKIPVNVEHLSSGEKTLLWLALTLFNSQYYEIEMAAAPKVLMLDEPDAFLHPKMVAKMYEVFKSFNENFDSIILITTHSPTSVALAPSDKVYLVNNNSISGISKDEAISELLDGVSQISISPENRRQVYVESHYDASFYTEIYLALMKRHESKLDKKVSLSFIPAGEKVSEDTLRQKLRVVLGITQDSHPKVDEFVQAVNGVGSCDKVLAQVEALNKEGSNTVRGIVDWDGSNRKRPVKVSILAKGYAYAIDNLALDPVSVMYFMHLEGLNNASIKDFCGKDMHLDEWLASDEALQKSVDMFIEAVLGRASNNDAVLNYVSGRSLKIDREYLIPSNGNNGHWIEKQVKNAYPNLKSYDERGKDGALKKAIALKVMTKISRADFIPQGFEDILIEVQK